MNKKLYIESIFLILLGTITSLSLPPFNYLIINFFTFSSFFIFLFRKFSQQNNKKLFFIYGWLFGFGYFLSSLYWISISLTFDQDLKFLIPLTIILIPAFLALFYGLVSLFFLILKPKKIISSFLTFSLIFGIFEFIRGSILTGFPWNLIAYSFSNQLELLSITSLIGTYGFNLFCISLFTSPAILILRDKNKDVGISIFLVIALFIFYIYGTFYKEKFDKTLTKNFNYKIRVIGSNISLDRFYENIDTASVIQDLINLSDPDVKDKTIFIWPEGILSNVSQEDLFQYSSLFDVRFNKNHLLVIGTNSVTETEGEKKHYNSLTIYDYKLNILNSIIRLI